MQVCENAQKEAKINLRAKSTTEIQNSYSDQQQRNHHHRHNDLRSQY